MNGKLDVEIGRESTSIPALKSKSKQSPQERKGKTKMNDRTEEDATNMDNELKDQYPVLIGSWDTFGVPLEVISDDGRVLTGRPVLTMAVDSATRTVVGMRLHVEGPDVEKEEGKG